MKKNFTRIFALMFSLLMIVGVYSTQLETVFEIDFTSTYWSSDFSGSNNSGKGSAVTDKNGNSYYGYSVIKPTTEITAGSTWTGYLEFGGTARFLLLPAITFVNGGEVTVEWGAGSSNRSIGLYVGSPNTNNESSTGITGDGSTSGDNGVNYVGKNKTTFSAQTFTLDSSIDGEIYLRLSATNASGISPSAGSGTYIKKITVKTNSSGPSISLTSGDNPATTMEDVEMTPIVYTYSNVADADNVLFDWYTDNTYTTTTTAPAGLSLDKDTDENTVTISGTPTTLGNYYYKVAIDEDGGNEIEGVIVVEAYVASSDNDLSNLTIGGQVPVFDAETNTYTLILPKASSLVQAVSFDMHANASANFTSGNTHDFATPLVITVTAEDLSTQVFTLDVKVTEYNIAYIIDTGVAAKDIKILPALKSAYYVVNIPIATITTSYDFSDYDVVVLSEAPKTNTDGMRALWGIDKPLLSLKMYALQANTWNIATTSNPSPAVTTVLVNEPNHPLYTGITFTGVYANEIEMFDAISSSNGVQTAAYTGDYNLASISSATTPGIIELPVGTSSSVSGVTNSELQEILLTISISGDNQDLVTANSLKLIENGIAYLAGSTTWGVDAGTAFEDITFTASASKLNSVYAEIAWTAVPAAVKYIVTQVLPIVAAPIEVTGDKLTYTLTGLSKSTEYKFTVEAQNAAGVTSATPASVEFMTLETGVETTSANSFIFDGKTIRNINSETLVVFDATGRMVLTSNKDVDMTGFNKGIYIIQSSSAVRKIAVTK